MLFTACYQVSHPGPCCGHRHHCKLRLGSLCHLPCAGVWLWVCSRVHSPGPLSLCSSPRPRYKPCLLPVFGNRFCLLPLDPFLEIPSAGWRTGCLSARDASCSQASCSPPSFWCLDFFLLVMGNGCFLVSFIRKIVCRACSFCLLYAFLKKTDLYLTYATNRVWSGNKSASRSPSSMLVYGDAIACSSVICRGFTVLVLEMDWLCWDKMTYKWAFSLK